MATANLSPVFKDDGYVFTPIGTLESVFLHKNGTPRQPTVSSQSRASLTINKSVFNNPEHSLEGLEEYSHIWLLFVFHLNNNVCTKAKVKPPRLNGQKLGLFATRCPYRPVPIGLTLAKLESIVGATVHLSGVDIIHGTPILDIKPYIDEYDKPALATVSQPCSKACASDTVNASTDCAGALSGEVTLCSTSAELNGSQGQCNSSGLADSGAEQVHAAQWLDGCRDSPNILSVEFTARASAGLSRFEHGTDSEYGLSYFKTKDEAKGAIIEVLLGDPRSAYRRKSCSDRLYYFSIDRMHVTCWFDGSIAEVLKVQPVSSTERQSNNP